MTLTVNCQTELKVDEFGECSLAGTFWDGPRGKAVKRGCLYACMLVCLYACMMQIEEGPLYRAVASVISE
jgi:hypothetical protein